MTTMRGFSASRFVARCNPKNDSTKEVLERVLVAEDQAVALAKTLSESYHLTMEDLGEALASHLVGPVDLSHVVAFLSGYMSSETFDSRFDVEIFGEMSTAMEAKGRIVGSALAAIISYMDSTGIDSLPDRVPPEPDEPEEEKTDAEESSESGLDSESEPETPESDLDQ